MSETGCSKDSTKSLILVRSLTQKPFESFHWGWYMSDVEVIQPNRILSSIESNKLLDDISCCLENGRTNILLDLQHVSFMDSRGLAALVVALKQVRDAQGRFAICRLGGQARMLFELTGMDESFEIYASPEEFSQVLKGS